MRLTPDARTKKTNANKNKKVPDKFLYTRTKLHGALHARGHNINSWIVILNAWKFWKKFFKKPYKKPVASSYYFNLRGEINFPQNLCFYGYVSTTVVTALQQYLWIHLKKSKTLWYWIVLLILLLLSAP